MGVLCDWQIERDVKITPFSPCQKRPGLISYGLGSYGYDVRLGYKGKIFTDVYGTVIDPKNFDPKALVEVDLTPFRHAWSLSYPKNDPQAKNWRCMTCHEKVENDLTQEKRNESCPKSDKLNHFLIPPNSFMLGESLEHFDIPRDVLCVVLGKSTYARCGLIVNVTPGEPEWAGHWTIEISNTTRCYAKVYAGEGIMQAIFLRTDGYSEMVRKVLLERFSNTDFGAYNTLQDGISKATCKVSYKDKAGKYANQTGLTPPKVD